jgi:hypothetical protein
MKRHGNLWPQIIEFANLTEKFRSVIVFHFPFSHCHFSFVIAGATAEIQ